MKITLYIIILTLPFLLSCSTKNYQKIDGIKNQYNAVNTDNSILLQHKKFNPSKKVFAKLNGVLSNDFIYIFSWVNHLPRTNNHFSTLIFDKKNSRKYYIFNTEDEIKTILIKESKDDYEEQKLILEYYLKGEIDILESLSSPFISSEIGTEYYLFNAGADRVYIIKNLVLNDESKIFK